MEEKSPTIINGLKIENVDELKKYPSLKKYIGKKTDLPYPSEIFQYIFYKLKLYDNPGSFDIYESYGYFHCIKICYDMKIEYTPFVKNMDFSRIDRTIFYSLFIYLKDCPQYNQAIKKIEKIEDINNFDDTMLSHIININPSLILSEYEKFDLKTNRLTNLIKNMNIDSIYDYIEESYNFYTMIKIAHQLGLPLDIYLYEMEYRDYDIDILLSLFLKLKDYDEYKATISSIDKIENISSVNDYILSYILNINPKLIFDSHSEIEDTKMRHIIKDSSMLIQDIKKYYHIIRKYIIVHDITINIDEINPKFIFNIINDNRISLYITICKKITLITSSKIICEDLLYPVHVGMSIRLYHADEYYMDGGISKREEKYYEIQQIYVNRMTNKDTLHDCIIILKDKLSNTIMENISNDKVIFDCKLKNNYYCLLTRLPKKYYDV